MLALHVWCCSCRDDICLAMGQVECDYIVAFYYMHISVLQIVAEKIISHLNRLCMTYIDNR